MRPSEGEVCLLVAGPLTSKKGRASRKLLNVFDRISGEQTGHVTGSLNHLRVCDNLKMLKVCCIARMPILPLWRNSLLIKLKNLLSILASIQAACGRTILVGAPRSPYLCNDDATIKQSWSSTLRRFAFLAQSPSGAARTRERISFELNY